MSEENFLGLTPAVEEDEPDQEQQPVSLAVPVEEDIPEEIEEEVPQEVEEQEFDLQGVVSKFSPEAKQDDEKVKLERELAVLRAEWNQKKDFYDKAILGREEKEVDPLSELETPEVGRMLQEAMSSDDPTAFARLQRKLTERIAGQTTSQAAQDLAKRLEALEQGQKRDQQVQQFKSSIGGALNHLAGKGKVCQALVAEFHAKGEESQLWKTWAQAPEIMRNSQLMAVAGVGLARLLEDAAGTSEVRAEPVQAAPSAPPKDSSTGTRPKASSAKSKLNTDKKEPDDYESVMAALRSSGSGAKNWLNTF